MKKTTQGFLAGAAGLGLLLGGSTFALWTDGANVPDSTITAGNLEVKVDAMNWRDMSDDRTDKGHKIKDLRKFRIIPGDKIQGEFGVDVALQGDNMLAELSLTEPGTLDKSRLARALDIDYEIRGPDGKKIHGDRHGIKVLLASTDNENTRHWDRGWRNVPTVPTDRGGRAEFTVLVTVKFKDTDDLSLRKAQAQLLKSELELTQVRKGPGYGHGGPGPRDASTADDAVVENDAATDAETSTEPDVDN